MIYKLKPILKHRLWGGSYLPNIYNIDTNDKIGEAWILSCIDDNNNLTDTNESLKDLFDKDSNIVAKGYKGQFPILIKLIDAKQDLSIQVHPSIKTEFWYVFNTNISKLYMGFNKNTNKDEVENALKNSTLPNLLNNIDVKLGDSYLIKPGTIHAIGAGTKIIEIQQSADVTYRLYDYDRVDSNGKKRPLHIKESLDCIDYKKLEIKQNSKSEHLVSCPYFNVHRLIVDDIKELEATDKSFNALTVLYGSCFIRTQNQTISLNTYDTVFIPAGEGKYTIEGASIVILTTL